jgi:hydrogenase maturation protease
VGCILSPLRGWNPLPEIDLQIMPRVLIIAYGNPLRSDDGVAWRAADELEKKLSGADVEVEIRRCHQLTPELAETICRSEAVIFVDAASAGGGNGQSGDVRCAAIGPPEGKVRFSHQLSPGAAIELARQLYGASPRAYAVTLTGECFDHGEALSPVVAAALPALVKRIEALVQELGSPATFPPDSN